MWALPSPSHTTYAPYDETCARGELIGHTDAVWDLALVRDEGTLISCGSEGAVKVWDVSGPSGGGSLRLSWGWTGLDNQDELGGEIDAPGATAVEAIKADLKKVAVAYQNAVVKIFDIESGKEISRLSSESYGMIPYDLQVMTCLIRLYLQTVHPQLKLIELCHIQQCRSL